MSKPQPAPKRAWFALAIAATALMAALISVSRTPQRSTQKKEIVSKETARGDDSPIGEAKPGYEPVGGVYRPTTDVAAKFEKDINPDAPRRKIDFGQTSGVKPNENRHTMVVAEAMRTGEHPERLSNLVMGHQGNSLSRVTDRDHGVRKLGRANRSRSKAN